MHFPFFISFILLVALFTFAVGSSNAEHGISSDEGTKTSTAISATNSSVTPITPPTSTKAPTTPPTSTTAPTTPPTSTTAPTTPPTSTTAPTTPATSTTAPTTPATSTTAPTTPATSTTAPTPAPTPPPKPAANWVVKENGSFCIIANMNIKMSVPYKTTNKTVSTDFNLEHVDNATASGVCGKRVQTLTLIWKNITINSTFTFLTTKDNASYALASIEVVIPVNNETFPNNTMVNASQVTLKYDREVFSLPKNHSYICDSVQPLSLNGTEYNKTIALNRTVTGSITITKLHIEAFGIGKDDDTFSAEQDCSIVHTPDIVAIAVGLVLFSMVIIVLIAFLIGRRRAHARGYLSM